MLTAGTLRIAVELGLITCIGVFNPVLATYQLDQTEPDWVARLLSAWSVTTGVTIAALTALGGLLASMTGPRAAIAIAGLLLLTTPVLLPRHDRRVPTRRDAARSWSRAARRAPGPGGRWSSPGRGHDAGVPAGRRS